MLLLAGSVFAVPRFQDSQPAPSLDAVNRRFLDYLSSMEPVAAVAVARLRAGWESDYRKSAPESFIPDALAQLHADFAQALAAFDADKLPEAEANLLPLQSHPDPYVAAGAAYLYARVLAGEGRFEEVVSWLSGDADRLTQIEQFSPYGSSARLLKAVAEAKSLQADAAADTLSQLTSRYPNPAPMQRLETQQLRLEIERREHGNLGEVSSMMNYLADRLAAKDVGTRVKSRQGDVLALLDKLIDETQQQEQQSKSQSQSQGGASGNAAPTKPENPLNESNAPEANGPLRENLGAMPKLSPGEMWGKLPPAERERILQSLRERYPSRYRELVEQYYRSLAEEK